MFMTSRNFIGSIFSTSQPYPAAMHLGIHHLWRRFSLVTGTSHLYDWLPHLQKSLEKRILPSETRQSSNTMKWQWGNHGNPRIDIYSNKPYAFIFIHFPIYYDVFVLSTSPRSGAQPSPVAVATRVASQEPSPLQTHKNDRKPPKRALNLNGPNKLQVTQETI